ncbi:MAG: hypothetical protein ABFC96_06595 [Thermoguttaceae bacterium]
MVKLDGQRLKFRGFRRGQSVTIRDMDEILETLDAEGRFEGMPFMPEMAAFCGKTFRVHRRAERTCVEGTGTRRLSGTVLLDGLRCDGSAHAGCERGCLFFWKEVWLKPADLSAGDCPDSRVRENETPGSPAAQADPTELEAVSQLPTTRDGRFFCQSTELAGATTDLPPGKLWPYWTDLRTGELRPRLFAHFLWMSLVNGLWRKMHGRAFHELTGPQKKTLTDELNLEPGEWVEIKSAAEIAATLDPQGRNRGLAFEREMALHCGRRYRVAKPIRTIIVEETGKMVQLANTVILEGLICQGVCSANCPRANHLYWREIWLRRVMPGPEERQSRS